LVKALLSDKSTLMASVSYTTRLPRESEIDGQDYFFVTHDDFKRMHANNLFLETAECHGHMYGTSKENVQTILESGKDIILEIDWQGALSIKKLFPDSISIFVLPPSVEALLDRLNARNEDSQEVIKARMEAAQAEMQHMDKFDYVTINDDFDVALQELKTIIEAEDLKSKKQISRHSDMIKKLLN
jgi:guanylate kinase